MPWPFPRPYPDELIGSVILRACVHSGLAAKTVQVEYLQRPHGQMSLFLPTGLTVLAQRIGLDAEELAERHTLLPYATAFMPEAQARAFRDKALHATPDGPGCLGTLTSAVTHAMRVLRICPTCLRDDIAAHGEAYWHRSHLLPGVHLCAKHDHLLLELPWKNGRTASTLARLGGAHVSEWSYPSLLPVRPLMDALARVSLEALAGPWRHKDGWAHIYRSIAIAKGYGGANDMVASAPMCVHLVAQYGQMYLQGLRCEVKTAAHCAWPALMVRPGTAVAFTPVKHALLRAFLECCAAEPKELGYRPTGKRPKDPAAADTRCAALIRRAWRKAAAARIRLTIREILESMGAWSAFRHNRRQWPHTAAVLAEFKQSAQAERQRGRRPYWRLRLGLNRESDEG